MSDRPRRVPSGLWICLAVAIVIAAFAIRWVGIDSRGLSADELWSVSLAKDGPWTALLTAVRFDVHPPLYLVQLSLWMMLGDSDQWVMLNSIAWGTAAVALLTFVVSEFHGRRVGLGAGALLAVAPGALSYSDDVRMYSMLLVLIVLAWYLQMRWLNQSLGRRGWIWLILSQCAVAYTHGAGLIMLSGCVLLGFATCLVRRDWRMLWRWLGAEVVVLILVTPTLVVAFMRGVNHPAIPGISNFLQTWAFLTTGQSTLAVGFVAIGLVLLAALGFAASRSTDAAMQIICLVFAPLILAATVSHAFRPIWLDRTFYTVIPFICLGLARLTLENRSSASFADRFGVRVFALLMLGWLALGITDQVSRTKGDGFREAAEMVRKMQQPGDVIVVGPDFSYWYFMWYYQGRNWGMPLHAFLLNADWSRMLARLPQGLVAIAGMSEADRILPSNGATVMLWDPDRPIPAVPPGRIIAVGYRQLPAIATPGYRPADKTVTEHMNIELWEPIKIPQ